VTLYRNYTKRLFDVLGAILLIVMVFPLIVTIAILVRAFMGAPVLFRQLRPGRQGASFTLLKFRTMSQHRGASGELAPDEQRITSVGRFLRAFSLDELPELFNVVRGDMSLVGPRPLLMEYLSRYSPQQARRHEVRPGITGWAQVNGRNCLSWEQRFEHDVWYVDHMSLWLDLRILMKTVVNVLKREGISASGHATMPRFMGSQETSNGSGNAQ
jgi:sugar transferase EpsL